MHGGNLKLKFNYYVYPYSSFTETFLDQEMVEIKIN
jgi:hypothetical protein